VSSKVITWSDARRELPKEVYKALEEIRKAAPGTWELRRSGHKAVLVCDQECCRIQVNGTPRVPHRHARDIARRAALHPLEEDDPRRPLGSQTQQKRG